MSRNIPFEAIALMTINFTIIAHFLAVYPQRGTDLPQAHTSTMELRAIMQQFYHELSPIFSEQPLHIKTSPVLAFTVPEEPCPAFK